MNDFEQRGARKRQVEVLLKEKKDTYRYLRRLESIKTKIFNRQSAKKGKLKAMMIRDGWGVRLFERRSGSERNARSMVSIVSKKRNVTLSLCRSWSLLFRAIRPIEERLSRFLSLQDLWKSQGTAKMRLDALREF